MKLHARDIRRGDVITARAGVPTWTDRALVLAARWYPTHLSLDLRWLDTGQVMTGCALSADDEFTVERSDVDPLVEAARSAFAAYCRRRGL